MAVRSRWLGIVVALVAGACGAGSKPVIDPTDFVEAIDNPYLPFTPGTRWVYEGDVDGAHERIEVTVTSDRKEVLGVSALVVSDVNYVDGDLVAKTVDWYAQDRDGKVWYLGEATEEYENGELVGTEGSWEAGVDGAEPGIFMVAEPRVGETYHQHDQDAAEVVRLGVDHSIGPGDYRDVVVVLESSPQEPDVVEEKYYAPGVSGRSTRSTRRAARAAPSSSSTPPGS
jgi:hypothetical protein